MDFGKRAVIYVRVSTSRQADKDFDRDGFSIPSQREACIKKAQSLSAVVVDEYLDRGESARTADRPAFQEMIARITTQRDIDYVIVHKVDRWARNREDDVIISMAIRKAGATLVSATENIDETPSGKFLHAIMAGMAEFYSANLATEVLKGTTQKVSRGGTPYLAPVGYLNVGQVVEGREVRTVVVDPERGPHIEWAFQTYATGACSIIQLTRLLADRGLTTRPAGKRPAKPLIRSRVHRMLTNRYYLGVVSYQAVEHEGRHEALVSVELFDRVQSVLRAHDRAADRQRKHHHYLKGSVRCARCGSRLVLTKARSHTGELYWYFFCTGRRSGCDQPYVPIAELEAEVIRYYQRVHLTPEETAELSSRVRAAIATQMQCQRRVAKRERDRLTKLDAERSKLLTAYYAGAVPLDQFRAEQDRITSAASDAKRQLTGAEAGSAEVEEAVLKVISLLGDCHAAYRDAPNHVRRLFNQSFFKRLEIDMRSVTGAELTNVIDTVLGFRVARPAPERSDYQRQAPEPVFCGLGSNKNSLAGERGFEPLIG